MKWFVLLTAFVGSTTIFAQTTKKSNNVFERLSDRFERCWTIEPLEPVDAGDKVITIRYSVHDGTADIFIIDNNNLKINQFMNLATSGVAEMPMSSISPGDYHVIMMVNSRRVAIQSFSVK
jgi:hypothetical protein